MTAIAPMTFKLRPDEREMLLTAAAEIGMGPSSFCAQAVRQALGSERRRPLPRPRSDMTDAVREATGSLGRLGNLVNQIARRANMGDPVDASDLATIRIAMTMIDAKLGLALGA